MQHETLLLLTVDVTAPLIDIRLGAPTPAGSPTPVARRPPTLPSVRDIRTARGRQPEDTHDGKRRRQRCLAAISRPVRTVTTSSRRGTAGALGRTSRCRSL